MRILVCHIPGQLRPETVAALTQHASNCQVLYHELDADDPFAYGQALAAEWRLGLGVAVIEPDIVVRADVIAAFRDDSAGYVCFPYPWLTDIGPALGCTRFSAAFQRRYPTAVDEAVKSGCMWTQFDVVLMRHILARKYGCQPKVCLPPVEHLNELKALLATASREPLLTVPHW